MTKRESRVVNSFISCVESGEFTYDYACLLIEDQQKYGYLSTEAKEKFYTEVSNEPTDDELLEENEAMKESLARFGVTEETPVTEVTSDV